VEHQQIELDYCPNCEGTWFDSDELDLLLECAKLPSPELVIGKIVSLPVTGAGHEPLKCPICRQNMKEVAIGGPAIHIDVCEREDGLWFDGGEMNALLTQLAGSSAAPDEEQPVFEFLKEVFKARE